MGFWGGKVADVTCTIPPQRQMQPHERCDCNWETTTTPTAATTIPTKPTKCTTPPPGILLS